jgi:hypothetical protein
MRVGAVSSHDSNLKTGTRALPRGHEPASNTANSQAAETARGATHKEGNYQLLSRFMQIVFVG